MDYRSLGRTGIKVSPICLGAMMFGPWGGTELDESAAMVGRALEAGVNFVDTADVYSWGGSEEIVGQVLEKTGARDKVVLASKFHNPMGEDPNQRGNSRRWITTAVEDSLRRLRTDWIDVYQVHRPDPDTDIEETLGAMSDLVRSGKVRQIGTSTFPASMLVEAQWAAERRGYERFTTEQPPYSILARGIEAEVLPVAQRYGLGVLTWSPLAGGWLTGRYRVGDVPDSRRSVMLPDRYDMTVEGNQRKLAAADALATLAEESGLTLIELSLGFVLAHPAVTSVIIGPRTMEHLDSQLPGADVRLPADVLDRIDEIVPPGVTLNAADAGWSHPALSDPAHRRR